MISLQDNTLNLQYITDLDSEATSWTNSGLNVIILNKDNISGDIVSFFSNRNNTESYNLYDDTMSFLQIDPEPFRQNTDKIYDYRWRIQSKQRGKYEYASTNVQGEINTELIDNNSRISGSEFIGVIFYAISKNIKSIDKHASELRLNYLFYGYTLDNHKKVDLRKKLNSLYLYTEADNISGSHQLDSNKKLMSVSEDAYLFKIK